MSREGGLTEAARRLGDAISRTADPAVRVTVHGDYAPDWDEVDQWADDPDADGTFDRLHAYVFPAGKAQAATASRGKDLSEYRLEVVLVERYDGAEAVPPRAWVKGRIDWVEVEVFDRFNDARADPYPVEGYYPQSVEWVTAYDPADLRERKMFRSGLVITLRRLEG